jgi:hypothetical protein
VQKLGRALLGNGRGWILSRLRCARGLRRVCRRRVGVGESGEPLGHDLGCFLLLLDGRRLWALERFAGGQVLLLLRREARLGGGDHQHFVEPVEMGGRLDDHVDKVFAVRVADDLLHHAHRESAREDLVAAGGEHGFARLDAAVGEDADDLRLAGGVAAQDAANARGLQDYSCAAGLVVDGQNLGRMGKDLAHLAYDSVGGNHSHIAVQAVGRTLVKIEDARLIAAAGADSLRGNRRINVFLLEAEELLQPLALAGIFKQGSLLQAEAVDGLLQFAVLFANVAQVKIVLPQVSSLQLGGLDNPLCRRNQRIGPQPDEPYAGRVLRVEGVARVAGAAHLHSEADDLRPEDGQQYE